MPHFREDPFISTWFSFSSFFFFFGRACMTCGLSSWAMVLVTGTPRNSPTWLSNGFL